MPLIKTVPTCVPLKKLLAAVCHHTKLFYPPRHSIHDRLEIHLYDALTGGSGHVKCPSCSYRIDLLTQSGSPGTPLSPVLSHESLPNLKGGDGDFGERRDESSGQRGDSGPEARTRAVRRPEPGSATSRAGSPRRTSDSLALVHPRTGATDGGGSAPVSTGQPLPRLRPRSAFSSAPPHRGRGSDGRKSVPHVIFKLQIVELCCSNAKTSNQLFESLWFLYKIG
jgi:hypothetical protein